MAQIAKELGIPESTTRFYRDRHADFVPVVGEGRGRRYPLEALQVLRTIADLSRQGTPAEGIQDALSAAYPVNAEPQQPTAATQQQTAAGPQPTATTALQAQQDAERMRALLADMIREAVREETSGLMAEVVALRDDVARLTSALTVAQQQAAAQPQPTAAAEPQRQPQPTATRRPPWWKFWSR